jgi:predicted dehydrogenase
MNSRRSFIKKAGVGAATAFALPSMINKSYGQETSLIADQGKKIVIGIIGAENSHTVNYGRFFNIERKFFPDVSVGYVWGETEEFARHAMKAGAIPEMVKDPQEMLGKIDALIVDHRHAKYHLSAATPFVKAGIPTFIDKPFCYRAEEGREFLLMARNNGTPVSSYSSFAQSRATQDIKKQVETYPKIHQVVMFGHADIESESQWGGIFYYGVHMVQQLMVIFGEDIKKVRVSKSANKVNATLVYTNGLLVTFIFSSDFSGWKILAETNTGYHELKSRVWDEEPERYLTDMVHMFRTGKEPRSYQSILNSVSILEAIEASTISEKWVDVKYLSI